MILCQRSSTMNLDSTKPLLTTPSRKAHFRNFDRTRRDILRIYTHNTTILLSTLPILFPALPRRTCRRPLFPEYVNVLLETCRISDYIKDSFAKSSASKFRSRMTRFTAYLRYDDRSILIFSTLPILFPAFPRRTWRRLLFPEYVKRTTWNCRDVHTALSRNSRGIFILTITENRNSNVTRDK